MFNQAKFTMDNILFSVDETNYYQHVGATDLNVTRNVGIDTIIPTLYTYITTTDDSIRINIVDKNDKLKQVFDSEIEGVVSECANRVDNVLEPEQIKILNRYNEKGTDLYMFDAAWVGNNAWTIDRINAYVYGYSIKVGESIIALNYEDNNLLGLVENEDTKFKESYVEYQKDGIIYWNDEHTESIVVTEGSTKTIITYKQK